MNSDDVNTSYVSTDRKNAPHEKALWTYRLLLETYGERELVPRREPVSTAGFRKTLTRIGEASRLAFPVHPHMLRHACGFKLANDGHDTRAIQYYLGHRNIQHTVRYTELTPARFQGFWKD